MNSYLRKAIPFYVLILSVAVLLLIPSFSDTAHAQCAVSICKSAPQLPVPQSPEDFVIFPFTVSQGGDSDSGGIVANFECEGLAFSGDDLEIVEDSFPGWELESVECSDSALIDVTFIENGVSLDCLGGTEITCTFTNVRGASPIPTLSEWGMIAAAAGLILIGVFFAVRRKKALSI
ncbi:MAG: IPTL-CTERM sorting domain-containing protein [Thermodesulfobacteriota bacterium]